jgi:hypothetical protein
MEACGAKHLRPCAQRDRFSIFTLIIPRTFMKTPVRFPLTGAIAGAFSSLVFMFVHDLLISDIWFSLVTMLVSGALCGAAVAWTYAMLFSRRTIVGWLGYNLLYVGALVAIGLASLLIYEPVATAADLIAAGGGAPIELIRQATPLSVASILIAASVIHWLWGRGIGQFLAIFLTCALVIVLLGINVSVLGLVEFNRQGWMLVVFTYGLTLLLNATFVTAFVALEWRIFRRSGRAPTSALIPESQAVPAPAKA